MFTDIVGSTALRDTLVALNGESDGNRIYGQRFLDPHNKRIRGFIESHQGFEVKTIGDSFMVAFAQPENAVRCAVDIQRNLRDEPIATDDPCKPLAVRIGMHTGAAKLVERDGRADYDGHAVNIAARVESMLKGGERIYCSRATAALANAGPAIRFHSYGPYLLKGVSEKIEIVDVLWDDAMQPAPPEQAHERLLYPWLTKWIGREREMAELEEALRSSRLVTLHGIGGVGKTRLAVETLLARSGGLPREIVFVSLERVADTPEGLLGAIRDAIGLTEVDAPDFDALCRQLHGGDRLLLLDNFESAIRAGRVVPRLAATAGVRVFITSQQILGVNGERLVEVEPMVTKTNQNITALESYRLLVTLAQQRGAQWQPDDDDAMRDVLAATDGLPYLIEIVAAVVPKRRLRKLADELRAHLTKVRSRVEDDSRSQRHASVQACLEWALSHLSQEGRQALPRLAIFAGGFDGEAAEAVAETHLASLDVLVDASLLRFDHETGRYSMLGTTRQFASELVADDQRKALALAHARWFIERLIHADGTMRAKGGEAQTASRRWIDTDFGNLQQAVAWAEGQDSRLFERAVAAFGMYLDSTYRWGYLVHLNEVLLRNLNPETNARAWARTQSHLGSAYWGLRTGDRSENLAKAIACYERALQVHSEHGSPTGWATAQNNLGIAYRTLPTGDRGESLVKAIACFEAALRVIKQHDSPRDWATAQNNLGIAYRNLPTGNRGENLGKAIACYEAALHVATEREFPALWATTQNNLGVAYSSLPTGDRDENLTKAIACFEAALRVRTEREFSVGWATMQNNLASAYADLSTGERGENLAKAIEFCEAALRVRTEHEYPMDWAATQNNLGIAYANLPRGERGENLAKAIGFFEAALRVRTERDFPEEWATTQYNLGNVHEELAVGRPGHNLRQAILCFESAARGLLAVGLMDDAKKARQRATALAGELPSPPKRERKSLRNPPQRRKPRR